ncbi:MAG: hypothetical protein KatS3mg031_1947 [Chitinophagales bacterium]|nr:MAG: hypothetical protein KatS3mg031_1947 [Chitinophagales bacterium]
MKRFYVLPLMMVIGICGLFAQDNPNAPVMTFEFETYDFGEIKEGDEATVDFVFTNTGMEKLIITDVRASCGCTTPYWSKEPVLPGEKGKITASYNTNGRPGPFNKAITINSNAKEESKRIFIKGTVIGKNQQEISKSGAPERTPSIVNDLSDN